jgi:protein TonB
MPLVSGATLSLAAHAIALIIVAISLARSPASLSSIVVPPPAARLVFTAEGPGGGGREGGGEESAAPARRAQLVGREAVAIEPIVPPEAPERLALPTPPILSGLRDAVGAINDLRPVEIDSRGPGAGPGADGERGNGAGRGRGGLFGDRVGPGSDGVDGVQPGNGVTWPQLIQEVKPQYTADAMRARVEGTVELEVVVLADGSVGRIRLARSLDGLFGLDKQAIDAVRRWRFNPGTQQGKAIAVRVPVEVSFRLR